MDDASDAGDGGGNVVDDDDDEHDDDGYASVLCYQAMIGGYGEGDHAYVV